MNISIRFLAALSLCCGSICAKTEFDPKLYVAAGAVLPARVAGSDLKVKLSGTTDAAQLQVEIAGVISKVAASGGEWTVELTFSATAARMGDLKVKEFDAMDNVLASETIPDVAIGRYLVVAAPSDVNAVAAGASSEMTGGLTAPLEVRTCRIGSGGLVWAKPKAAAVTLVEAIGYAVARRRPLAGAVAVMVVDLKPFVLIEVPTPAPPPGTPPPPSTATPPKSMVEALTAANKDVATFGFDSGVGRQPFAFVFFAGRQDATNTAWHAYLGDRSIQPFLPHPEELTSRFRDGWHSLFVELNRPALVVQSASNTVVGPWIPLESTGWLDRYGVQAVQNGLAVAVASAKPAPRLVLPAESERLFFAPTGTPPDAKSMSAARRLADSVGYALE